MRRVEFDVPAEIFGDFTEKLIETGLSNSVLGRNEDDEIEVAVYYEKNESDLVDELEEYLNKISEEYYNSEEEEEEESEDED